MAGGFWSTESVRRALEVPPRRSIAQAPEETVTFSSVSTDTRTLEPGALFVAIRGERFDAHRFLTEATQKGARGAVVDRKFWEKEQEAVSSSGESGEPTKSAESEDDDVGAEAHASLIYFVVDDTLEALGRLGNYRRKRLGARVCAITGTNGKTTTKEMARAVIGAQYRVHATTGNLNNLVGTPLTLLAAPEDAEALVVEIGTSAPGEIERLARMVEPEVGILTTIAAGHLEGLGSLEGVLEEKTALLRALPPSGLGLVGEDPPRLASRSREMANRVYIAGRTERADPVLRATNAGLDEEGRVHFEWRGRSVRLKMRGLHNAVNAMLVLGLADEWEVPVDDAIAALENVAATDMRMEVLRFGNLRVIADCYNANPASLAAAADVLEAFPRGSGRVALVGSMLELGPASARLHAETAELLAGRDVDLIVATGEFRDAFESLEMALGDRLVSVDDPMESEPALRDRLEGEEVVLLKASRGVELERLLPVLEDIGAGQSSETSADRQQSGGN